MDTLSDAGPIAHNAHQQCPSRFVVPSYRIPIPKQQHIVHSDTLSSTTLPVLWKPHARFVLRTSQLVEAPMYYRVMRHNASPVRPANEALRYSQDDLDTFHSEWTCTSTTNEAKTLPESFKISLPVQSVKEADVLDLNFTLLEQESWESEIQFDLNVDEKEPKHKLYIRRDSIDKSPRFDHDEDEGFEMLENEYVVYDWSQLKENRKPISFDVAPHTKFNLRMSSGRKRPVHPDYFPPPRKRAKMEEKEYRFGVVESILEDAKFEDKSESCETQAKNEQLLHMEWLKDVLWDDSKFFNDEKWNNELIILDQNDQNLILHPSSEVKVEGEDERSPKVRYNISFDTSPMYDEDAVGGFIGKTGVQHALFARELQAPVFETYLSVDELKYFHRPRIFFTSDSNGVKLLSDEKKKKENSNRTSDMKKYVPKKEKDVFCRSGDVILLEYIEEHPLVTSNVGMASEFVVYYRQKKRSDSFIPEPSRGSVVIIPYGEDEETFFLGKVRRGSLLTGFINNLSTVPLFKQKSSDSLFLLSRTQGHKNWYIRELPELYTAGQVHPKVEVPAPGSRAANLFIKNRLMVEILRLLRVKPVLKISDVLDAFPTQSDASIRSRLKDVAEFQRGGPHSGSWKPKPDFTIPSEIEIQQMLTPEDVCTFHIMQAGKAGLERDGVEWMTTHFQLTNFIAKSPEDASWMTMALYLEELLKLTPWNLTLNFLQAWKRQILLVLSGPGNPMRRGEGFSFLRAGRPEHDPVIPRITEPRSLTGTEKDLRKLHMDQLRDALRKFQVPEPTIQTLKRWDMVKLLREQSSSAVREGHKTEFDRFARSHRNTFKDLRAQYELDAQKIFERHCEVLSTDELPSEDQELDDVMSEIRKNLEDAGQNKQETLNDEEQHEYQQFLREYRMKASDDSESKTEEQKDMIVEKHRRRRKLRMVRKTTVHMGEDGSRQEISELIDDNRIVEAFNPSEADGGADFQNLLAEYTGNPTESRMQSRKGRRRRSILQSSKEMERNGLRKRRVHKKSRLQSSVIKTDPIRRKRKKGRVCTLKCSACGTIGHTRLNKLCPAKQLEKQTRTDLDEKVIIVQNKSPILVVKATESSTVEESGENRSSESAMKIGDDGKLVFKISELPTAQKLEKKPKKRKRHHSSESAIQPVKISVRSRGDPRIRMSNVYKAILQLIEQHEHASIFKRKVDDSIAPGYSRVVKEPMYLDLMKQKCSSSLYDSIETFKHDLNLIVSNCETYNGREHVFSVQARELITSALQVLEKNVDTLSKLEGEIEVYSRSQNMQMYLGGILLKLMKMPITYLFRQHVDTQVYRNYLSKVSTPMCLAEIRQKLENNEYTDLDAVVQDFELIWKNSEVFNGKKHNVTLMAKTVFDTALKSILEVFPDYKYLESYSEGQNGDAVNL